jgi:hypothetical protein
MSSPSDMDAVDRPLHPNVPGAQSAPVPIGASRRPTLKEAWVGRSFGSVGSLRGHTLIDNHPELLLPHQVLGHHDAHSNATDRDGHVGTPSDILGEVGTHKIPMLSAAQP